MDLTKKLKMKQEVTYDKSCGIVSVYKNGVSHMTLVVREKAGHWGIPKGHPENNESELETAKREFSEETGIVDFDTLPAPLLTSSYDVSYSGRVIKKTVLYFLARVFHDQVHVPKDEIIGYEWLTFRDALKRVTYLETRKVLEDAENYIIHNPQLFL